MIENTNIELFKETMINAMIKNFKNDGVVVPVLMFYNPIEPSIVNIPPEYLESNSGKIMLSEYIKSKCTDPKIIAAGMAIEASGAKIDIEKNPDIVDKIKRGEFRVEDADNVDDYIIFIFSTPEKDEIHSYIVDVENKKILDKLDENQTEHVGGVFSKFFNWKLN
jgi:hypothetical protein